jgi:probable rRNA maturation factor
MPSRRKKSLSVEIRVNPQFASRIRRAPLVRVAERALRVERVRADVALYITGNTEIRKLNRIYHGTNAPTDVLSFPAPAPAYHRVPFLGDIVISYEEALAQAAQAGWRISDELELLTVHGILHLLGYDDLTPRKRAQMWKRQIEILRHDIRV